MDKCTKNDGIFIGSQFIIYETINALKIALEQAEQMAIFVDEVGTQMGHPLYVKIPFTKVGWQLTTPSGQFQNPTLLIPNKYWKYRCEIGNLQLYEAVFYKINCATYASALVQPFDKFKTLSSPWATQTGSDPVTGLPTFSDGLEYAVITHTMNIIAGLTLVIAIVKIIKAIGLWTTLKKFINILFGMIWKNRIKDIDDNVEDLIDDVTALQSDMDGVEVDVDTLTTKIDVLEQRVIGLAEVVGLKLTL